MKSLLCTIYKGSHEEELYLYVAKGNDLSQLPSELMDKLGELKRSDDPGFGCRPKTGSG